MLRWEDNIRKDLREIGWRSVDLIHLTKDRDHSWVLVNKAMNFVFHKRRNIS